MKYPTVSAAVMPAEVRLSPPVKAPIRPFFSTSVTAPFTRL